MRTYIQKLFGLDNRPAIIKSEKYNLEKHRNTLFSPSDEEPNADLTDKTDDTVYGYAEGQTFGIVYKDSKGDLTERYITVWSIAPGRHCLVLKARCNLRNSTRAFRVDRIDSIFDHDGEIFEVNSFLHETFGIDTIHLSDYQPPPTSSNFDSFSKIRKHIKADAVLLAGLSLADGRFCEDELEVGTKHLNTQLEKQGFLLSHQGYSALSRYFKRMKPDYEEIEQAIYEMAQLSPERQASFITSGLKLIKADGVITNDEQTMWNEFVGDLTGLTLS